MPGILTGEPWMDDVFFEKLEIKNTGAELSPDIWERNFAALVERDCELLQQITEELLQQKE